MPREFHEFGKPFESLPLVWQLFHFCVNDRIQDHVQSAEVPSTEWELGAEQQSWLCVQILILSVVKLASQTSLRQKPSPHHSFGNPFCEQRILPS